MSTKNWIIVVLLCGVTVQQLLLYRYQIIADKQEYIISMLADNELLKIESIQDLMKDYEDCLAREKRLESVWQRKLKNYYALVKLTAKRNKEWQKREKPKILRDLSLTSNRLGILERPTTESKWDFQIFSDAYADTFLVLRPNR